MRIRAQRGPTLDVTKCRKFCWRWPEVCWQHRVSAGQRPAVGALRRGRCWRCWNRL